MLPGFCPAPRSCYSAGYSFRAPGFRGVSKFIIYDLCPIICTLARFSRRFYIQYARVFQIAQEQRRKIGGFMENITDIRQTFDKESIAINGNKVTVLFAAPANRHLSQSIGNNPGYKEPGEYKQVFEDLIFNSDEMVIQIIPGGKMKIEFTLHNADGFANTCWFLPLCREMTDEEYRELMDSVVADFTPEEIDMFNRQFSGINMNDEEEVNTAAVEWVRYLNRRDFDEEEFMSASERWKHLREVCVRFFKRVPLGRIEVFDPNEEDGQTGFVEFQIDADRPVVCKLSGVNKNLFLSMVSCSDAVNFEVGDGGGKLTFVDMDFFA